MKIVNNLFAAAGLGVWLAACAGSASAQTVHGYLVQLKPNTNVARESPQAAAQRLSAVAADAAMADLPTRSIAANVHLLTLKAPLPNPTLADAQLRRLQLHPDVLHAEADVMLKPQRVPNDTSFNRLWHLNAPGTGSAAAINAVDAWDKHTGGSVVVAVLDSGIRPNHPDLVGKLLVGHDMVSEADYANDGNGRDTDPTDPGDWVSAADQSRNNALYGTCDIRNSSWHGTFIAGLIAASANNAQGTAGVSWGARILPVRVAGKCGALLSDLLDGMRWAAGLAVAGTPLNTNPAKIINVSFGGSTRCAGSAYQPVIDEVTAAGSLVVVAAGNDAGPPTRPADCRNVLSVGAVRADGLKTSYSNYGNTVSFMTTGGSTESSGANLLYSTANTGLQGPVTEGYATKQGTSFSAPVAAGVAALVASINPFLSPTELGARLKTAVRPFEFNSAFPSCSNTGAICNCNVNVCGSGMLDANIAVTQALIPLTKIAPVLQLTNGTFQTPTTVLAGGTLLLNGTGNAQIVSNAAGFGPLRILWRQTAGPVARINDVNLDITTVVLNTSGGTVTFELTLTDTAGRTASDSLSINTVAAATPAPPSSPSPSSGGGAIGLIEMLAVALTLLGLLIQSLSRVRAVKQGIKP